ncbi:MAG: hypothetical protein IKT65_07685 [Clostridia bacterium]|nr:hypothetical protein [Clostridia bacterium]
MIQYIAGGVGTTVFTVSGVMLPYVRANCSFISVKIYNRIKRCASGPSLRTVYYILV